MASATWSANNADFKKIVESYYNTIQRSRANSESGSKTLERSKKAVNKALSYCSERKTSSTLTESVNNVPANIPPRVLLPRRQSCSALNNRMSSTLGTRMKSNAPAEPLIHKDGSSSPPPPLPKRPPPTSSSENKERRKSIINGSIAELRSIVYKTIDRVLHSQRTIERNLPSSGNRTSNEKPISLHVLKQLTENTPDTLPRNTIRATENNACLKQCSESVDVKEDKGKSNNAPASETSKLLDHDTTSSSSDEESWTYVPSPLVELQVSMVDSVERPQLTTVANRSRNTAKSENNNEEPKKIQRHHYIRRPTKEAEKRKARRLKKRRVAKEEIEFKENNTLLHTVKIPRPKVRRPDSPVRKAKQLTRLATVPLQNLTEESDVKESFLDSDVGTNSFLRGIVHRPKSTLAKTPGVPYSISLDSKDEDDDDESDACSTSSSFSSFQKTGVDTNPTLHENATRIQSALCSNVNVRPINVPITPWNDELGQIRRLQPDHKFEKQLPEQIRSSDKHAETNHKIFDDFQEIPKNDMAITFIQRQFTYLETIEDNAEDVRSSSSASENSSSLSEGSSSCTVNPRSTLETDNESTSSSNSSCLSLLPPAPPPLPTSQYARNNKALRQLPLKVFPQPMAEDTIFTLMEGIPIPSEAAAKLKENFPLINPNSKSSRLSLGSIGKLASPKGVPQFKLNMEIFLRTLTIKTSVLLKSIKTLDSACGADTDCIQSLIQALPKSDEDMLMTRRDENHQSDMAENFLRSLGEIPRLREKLNSCNAFRTSTKFNTILRLITSLMDCYLSEDAKYYGFDIQSLKELGEKTSKDGTKTLLYFIIEYIVDTEDSSLQDAADFYIEFPDLVDVSKTSLKDMTDQLMMMKMDIEAYQNELWNISKEIEDVEKQSSPNLEFANSFYKSTTVQIHNLNENKLQAEIAFQKCKESYGLTNNESTETQLFESLANFFVTYQTIHKEILEQKNRSNLKNARKLQDSPVLDKVDAPRKVSRIPVQHKQRAKSPTAHQLNSTNHEMEACLEQLLKPDKNRRRKSQKYNE